MKALILIGVTHAAILWVMYAAFQRWKRRANTYVKPAELKVGQKFYYYEDHSLRSARLVNNLPESSAVYARRVSDGRMVRIEYEQISRLV
jgi:hypothetical protein